MSRGSTPRYAQTARDLGFVVQFNAETPWHFAQQLGKLERGRIKKWEYVVVVMMGGNDLSNRDEPCDVVQRLFLVAWWLKERKTQTILYIFNSRPRLKELENLPLFEFNHLMNVKSV